MTSTARGPAFRAFQLSDAGKFDQAESVLRYALANLPQPDGNEARYWSEYALTYVFIAKKDWVEAQQHFDAAIAAPSRDPYTLPFLFNGYAQLARITYVPSTSLRLANSFVLKGERLHCGRQPELRPRRNQGAHQSCAGGALAEKGEEFASGDFERDSPETFAAAETLGNGDETKERRGHNGQRTGRQSHRRA